MIFLLLAVSWSAHLSSVISPSCQVPTLLYSWDAAGYTGEGDACVWGDINQKAEFLIVTAGEQSGLKGSVLLSPGVTQIEPLCVSPCQCVAE